MSLVPYPDSDEDDNDNDNDSDNGNGHSSDRINPPHTSPAHIPAAAGVKRSHLELNDLPPLPAAFHDLYSTNARISTSDDPTLHGGRKRAVPHVEGNWPSHVYLEWLPSQAESTKLHDLIHAIRDAVDRDNKARTKPIPVPDIIPSLQSELGAPLPLHISLSRTLQIKTEDRETFLDALKSCLRKGAIRAFQVKFTSLRWVPNYEGNRWFLVLSIDKPPQDELNRLLEACNEAADKCGYPGLYTGGRGDGPMEPNPSIHGNKKRRKSVEQTGDKNSTQQSSDRTANFHISIAWNLADPAPEWITLVRNIDVSLYIQSPEATFDAVKAKVGNVVHKVDLEDKKSGRRKGGGILGLS